MTAILNWVDTDEPVYGSIQLQEALLGTPNDGVLFCLTHHPTCYRRGVWRLLIEVCGGPNHYLWGCFDEADQPLRYYHFQVTAKAEAEAIAQVLWKDRHKKPLETVGVSE